MHLHHLNCVLLDPGSGCASPLSIDGVVFWCCYLVNFKNLNGPSRTNGARPLQRGWGGGGEEMGRGEEEMGSDREGVGKGWMAMGRGWRRYGQ